MRFAKAVRIATLQPWGKNPRQHGDLDVQAIVRSVERFGWTNPVLVQEKTNRVIAGHGRLEAAKKAGIKAIPCIYLKLTDQDADAYTVADNKLSELSKWDEEALGEVLAQLQQDNFDLSLIGFKESEIERLLAMESARVEGEDNVPQLPKTAISKKGWSWQLGDHRLMCGSSIDQECVGKLFGQSKAGILHTDPPYGVDYSKAKDGIPNSGFTNHRAKFGDIENDDLQGDDLQSLLTGAFKHAIPYLTNAAWYVWHSPQTQNIFSDAMESLNILLHRQLIWKKPGFVLTRSGMYHPSHEPCFYGWIRSEQPPWYGEKNQTSVWEVGRDVVHGLHPTQKPVELFEIPISNHLKRGEYCYDPFAGSGSQIIAAQKLERSCLAMEIEPRWCDVIVERWEQFTGGKAKRA